MVCVFIFYTVNICTKQDGSCIIVLHSPTWCRTAAFSTFPQHSFGLRRCGGWSSLTFWTLLDSKATTVTKCCGGEDAVGKGTIIQGQRVRDTFLPNTNSPALNQAVRVAWKKCPGLLDDVSPGLSAQILLISKLTLISQETNMQIVFRATVSISGRIESKLQKLWERK